MSQPKPEILAKAQSWLTDVFDEETKKEINNLIENDPSELEDSFYKNAAFGTGGMRGVMGVGTNRINKYTLGKNTQGLSNFLKREFSGETLKDLFNKEKIFPATFSQLIAVGEQTGSLDEMFGSIAIYYEEEFDVAVANLASLIEPIMIVFMGVTIGGLMLAMYAPIFSIGDVIG